MKQTQIRRRCSRRPLEDVELTAPAARTSVCDDAALLLETIDEVLES